MEVTDANIQVLCGYLQGTLNPDVKARKEAENFLVSVERNQNFPVLLLKLLTLQSVDAVIRQVAAVTFKNYVKRNWEVDAEDHIHPSDRARVKELVVELMLQSPEGVRKQLRAAIQIIGAHDFPEKWPDLIKILVSKLASGDFGVINGALQTANSLFKRYRHEMRSDTLFLEMKFVITEMGPSLTALFLSTLALIREQEQNAAAVKILGHSLYIIAKVFNSLNSQDLPEYFEDNMVSWIPNFCELLSYSNPSLVSDSDTDPGHLEKLKAEICDIASLYAQKYGEEFEQYLGPFVTSTWNLLTTTSNALKYDSLVGSAIGFLSSVAYRVSNKNLFDDDATLASICEKVIIPNMEFRPGDQELFEDSPEEYIRRDVEGSDMETRRRAACELVRALSMYFETKITVIFTEYVNSMLSRYASNPENHWREKDAALYLVTSLVAKGKTEKSGVTKANALVDIKSFFSQHILPELADAQVDSRPVVKADCLRYVLVFRSLLDAELVRSAIPPMVQHLSAKSIVSHSYAASAIEKILAMPEKIVSAADLVSVMEPLLKNLFAILEVEGSKENEYAMLAIMRVLACLGDEVVPILAPLLPILLAKLAAAAQNPKNPRYNHYLMEALCCSIQAACKANPGAACDTFEASLFPVFQEILQKDVAEFVPYVFQILALLLEMRKKYKLALPDPYMALLGMLLLPDVWETHGNIPPLSRLLRGFVNLGEDRVVSAEKVPEFLRIFQRLIASKKFDGEGFYLVSTILEMPQGQSILHQHFRQIFTLIFTRLTQGRTPKFSKHLIVFASHFVTCLSPEALIEVIDGLQAGMFGMFLERVLFQESQKITRNEEKEVVVTGLTKLLACEPMATGKYAEKWGLTFTCLVNLLQLPSETVNRSEVVALEHGEGSYEDPFETNVGYHGSYSRLLFAGSGENFPFKNKVPCVKSLLTLALRQVVSIGGHLDKLVMTVQDESARMNAVDFIKGLGVAI
ncbi:unnamed protein product [Notodromas monacha]|uniref:Exportin-2 n=1 Tax=Notodromas monacha TaxID=399045 RepID=A0A7R9BKE5_9CRUS|nr:unnamed protein product [Notodromas monacha]CAG0917110.1 unnamed protein product [Notodromas monacha]